MVDSEKPDLILGFVAAIVTFITGLAVHHFVFDNKGNGTGTGTGKKFDSDCGCMK